MSLKSDFLSIFPTSPEEMKMNLLTLSFNGKVEDEYKHHEAKRELGQRRVGIVIAVLIYALFGLMDMFLMPEVKYIAWFIRFGLFIPLALLVFIGSYWERIEGWMEALVSVVIIASGIGHLAILSYAPAEISNHYNMGLVIFMLFSLTILRTDFIKSMISGFIIFLGYMFYALQIEKASVEKLYISGFILMSCWVICSATCYLLEYKSRRNYYLNQIIYTGKLPKLSQQEVVKEKTVVKTIESPINKMYEHLTDFVWFLSISGELRYLSPSVKDYLGYEPEDLEGKRPHQIHSAESNKILEAELQRIGQTTNRVSVVLEYKTRAGLIKEGHAVIVKYQDKRMGEGYLGSTRVDEGLNSQKVVFESPVAQMDMEIYEAEKAKLYNDLLVAKEEIESLRNVEGLEMIPVSLDQKGLHQTEIVIQLFEAFKKGIQEEQLNYNEKLSIKAKQIEEKFSSQTMKKYDLENYLKETAQQISSMDKRVQLQQFIQEAFMTNMAHAVDEKSENVHVDQLIQKSIITMSPFFEGTDYVIDFDCPPHIELTIYKPLFKSMIKSLIALSMLYGFKSSLKGTIELKVEVRDGAIIMHYLDNGEDYIVYDLDRAINQLFDWDQRNPFIFNMMKKLVEEKLKGTCGFDLSESRNAIRVVLPLMP